MLVKAIDHWSKRGEHAAALGLLPPLFEIRPGDATYDKKRSHFIASLAARALADGDGETAAKLLEVADARLPDAHMTSFLREERALLWAQIRTGGGAACGPRREG